MPRSPVPSSNRLEGSGTGEADDGERMPYCRWSTVMLLAPPGLRMVKLEIPARLIAPKKRSSAVPPLKLLSAMWVGPTTPRDPLAGPKASNCVAALTLPPGHSV